MRGINGYESISEEILIISINESAKKSARLQKLKKDFNPLRDGLSNPKTKEIRKDLYRRQNKKLK